MLNYFYGKTNQMHQCIKFVLFWNDILHVSDGISVHHQEFKNVHTATKQILLSARYQVTALCLLASKEQCQFDSCMYSIELLTMDGKTVRNM